MLRRTAVSFSFFSVVKEELGKLPAYLGYKWQDGAKQHVDSAGKMFDFLKGNSPSDTPEMREKRQKHKEMYDALMKEQQAQAAEIKEKRKLKMEAMSVWEKAKTLAAEAKEALQQMTSTKAGAMALLQHCTTSHAAEVAIEQGIDVKNVRMVLEKQQMPNSLEFEEVVVGYIDAPVASDDEVFAFAEKLQKACPVANTMHIDWKRDNVDSKPLAHDAARPRVAEDSEKEVKSSVDFQTFAREGMSSFESNSSGEMKRESVGPVPAGMPGSHHGYQRSTVSGGGGGLGHGAFGEDESFHLPGVDLRQQRERKKAADEVKIPYGMPGLHRLRTEEAEERAEMAKDAADAPKNEGKAKPGDESGTGKG